MFIGFNILYSIGYRNIGKKSYRCISTNGVIWTSCNWLIPVVFQYQFMALAVGIKDCLVQVTPVTAKED